MVIEAETILALETAIDGGSISILRGGRQLASAEGARGLSKSEDILAIIENLLAKNRISKREIGTIAVSEGPGSLTGVRIGLAIARGLADSLAAKLFQISVLDALACLPNLEGRVLTAIYSEKSGIFFREFWVAEGRRVIRDGIVQKSKTFEFIRFIKSLERENLTIVLPSAFMTAPGEFPDIVNNSEKLNFQIVEGNLAKTIGSAVNCDASDNEN